MEPIVRLVKVVTRSFYTPKYIVFMDYLLRERLLPEDVLAERMIALVKDIGKIGAQLQRDGLISIFARVEERPYDGKSITRTYFYIDYCHFVNVVRYRLYKMRELLELRAKGQSGEQSYKCERCKKIFSSLDAVALLNPSSGTFECDVCGSELETISSGTSSVEIVKQQALFNESTAGIQQLLRSLEDVILPRFDPAEYLRRKDSLELDTADNEEDSFDQKTLNEEDEEKHSNRKQLKIAGSEPIKGPELKIELETSSSASSSSASQSKKPIHQMPVWHTHSTITGQQVKVPAGPVVGSGKLNKTDSSVTDQRAALEYESYYVASSAISESFREGRKSSPQPTPTVNVKMVTVQGVEKPLNEVTEKDKEAMTEEEYQKYYELYMEAE